jgi:ATP/maltotriose-dependent transcriptional regulator MalT
MLRHGQSESRFLPPTAAPSLLPRTALVSGMVAATTAGQLVLLDAPAGFGKSTALALYRDRQRGRGRVVAWLRLDEEHNDPGDFCRGVIDAMDCCDIPTAELNARLALCRVARDFASLALSITHQIARGTAAVCLILDDVQVLRSSDVRPLLQAVLSGAGASLHIALAGRGSAALSPLQLWSSGRATRFGALELSFSEEEAITCLAGVLTSAEARQMWEKTEGWPIAVQLSRLSLLERRSSPEGLLQSGGEPPELAHYLTASVIEQLPVPLRQSLLKLSILDVITPDLVEALCGHAAAATLVPALERLQLFVRPSPGAPGGTQFHPMFLDFLRRQARSMDARELLGLHRRAANRYREQGRLGQAVGHLIAAGDLRPALELLEREGRSIARLESDRGVLRHLDRLCEAELDAFPRLKLALIYHWAQTGRAERSLRALCDLETTGACAPQGGMPWADARLMCEATVYTYLGRKFPCEARVAIERWLLDRDPQRRGVRLVAAGLLVCDFFENCELTRIVEITADIRADDSPMESYVHLYLLCYRALALTGLGKLGDAFALCGEIEAKSRRQFGTDTDIGSVCRLLKVGILYLQGRICDAWALARSALADLEQGCGWFDVQLEVYGSVSRLVHLRAGRAAADELLVRGVARARCGGYAVLATALEAERVLLADRCGASEDAQRLAEQAGLQQLAQEARAVELPRRVLVSIRMVLSRLHSSRHDVDSARRNLDEARKHLRPEAPADLLVRAHLMRAALERSAGDKESTLRATREGLQIAAAHGIVAPLLEDKQHLTALRHLAADRGASGGSIREHAARCLEALRSDYAVATERPRDDASKPVSRRECQVLELLASGFTSKEIARRLQISPETARIHRKRLVRKLGARTRSEAIAAGRRLGLLRGLVLTFPPNNP